MGRIRVFTFLLAPALGLSALIAGCSERRSGTQAAQPAEVGVVTVIPKSVPMRAELPARVVAQRTAQVRARVTGVLLKQLFKDGAEVREGEVLFQIDPAPLQASYDSARAALAKAEATLAETQAKASRYEELVKVGAVSRQDYEAATAALGSQKAEVLASQAALKTAELNLGYANVTAPISGRIGKALVTEGALVSGSELTELAVIRQLDPIHVDFSQSSAEVLKLRKALESGALQTVSTEEASVSLVLEDGSLYDHTGRLTFSDISVDETTGMVTLRAIFPNPKGLLFPGMFVRVTLAQAVNEKALTIPQKAASPNPDGTASLFVVNARDQVEERTIKTGSAYGNDWVVTSGLTAGERVIVDGVQKVRAGANVKPVPAKEATSEGGR